MNTKDRGDVSTAVILASLVALGKSVSVPWGDNKAYDLILDDGGKLYRLQCKTGLLDGNRITFNTCSSYTTAGGVQQFVNYQGKIDMFAVYCPQLDRIYLVPIEDIPNSRQANLRLKPSRNRNQYGHRMAEQYELIRGKSVET